MVSFFSIVLRLSRPSPHSSSQLRSTIVSGMFIGWPRVLYQDLLVVPMYAIVGVTYLITIFATLARLLFWNQQWGWMKRLKEADQKLITYMLEGFFNMLHHREKIQDIHNRNEVNCSDVHKLHESTPELSAANVIPPVAGIDKTVARVGLLIQTSTILSSKWAMTVLSWYVANIASLAVFIFWDEFSVEEVVGCVNELDCYYPNGSLITDCYPENIFGSDREIFDKATCFGLTLDFPKAIAEVTGILFICSNGFAFLMFLLLLVIDGVASPLLRTIAYSIIAFMEYAGAASIIFAFVVRVQVLYKNDTINTIIEELLISSALLTGITTPWVILLWAVTKHNSKKMKLNELNVRW